MKALPNLFLVGGPKCGTTAFVYLLKQHSEIKWASHKEIDYFAKDIKILYKLSKAKNINDYLKKYFNFKKKIINILAKDPLFISIQKLQLKTFSSLIRMQSL